MDSPQMILEDSASQLGPGASSMAATTTGGSSSSSRESPHRQISSVDVPIVKTGIAGASSNLVNAIVGAGIIGIPYAINESGLVAGVVLLIMVGIFTVKSLRMIDNLASFHPKLSNLGVRTYEDLMKIPFGRSGKIYILSSMFVMAYGAMVAYLLIIKDNVPDLLGLGETFVERELVMFVTSLLIMLPLSMLRDISQLAFTSFLSSAADGVLVIVVCMYSPVSTSVSDAGGLGAVIAANAVDPGLFIGLGVLSTAMACQHSSFLISNTLQDHSSARWAMVTSISLWIATLMSLVLGVMGYLGFLENTQGDILKNFGQTGFAVSLGRALLAFTMFLTYPMESFVARHVLGQLLFAGNMDNTSVDSETGQVVPERKCWGCLGRRERWTIYLYVMALIPALIFKDLGPVLSLTGSLGASGIAYIAPGLVYLGVNGDDFLAWLGRNVSPGSKQHDSNHNITSLDNDSAGAGAGPAGEVELPVAGDARATMETIPEPTYPSGRKPWWWWPTFMPVWVAIASSGAHGCRTFLQEWHGESVPVPPPITGPSEEEEEQNIINNPNMQQREVIGPCKSDYIYSMVLIVFGVLAMVAGVISNVYVQVNKIFYTPT